MPGTAGSTTASASNPVVGAAISGGSGLLGSIFSGLFNNAAQRKQNKANRELQQMNNEFNAIEAAKARDWQSGESQKSRDWELDMWNLNNEYNDPSAQRERLERAGYNPNALVGSTGSYQSAVSQVPGSQGASSGPSASSASMPQQIAPQFQADFSSVAGAINSYYQNKATASQTVGQDIQNDIQSTLGKDAVRAHIMSELNGRSEWLLPEYSAGRNSRVNDLLGLDMNKMILENEALDSTINMHIAQGSLAYMQAASQVILNKYLDAQQQADLMVKSAEIYSNVMQGNLSKEKAQTEIQNQLKISAETAGIKLNNNKMERISYAIIDAISQEAEYHGIYYRELKRHARDIAKGEVETSNLDLAYKRFLDNNKELNAWLDRVIPAAGTAGKMALLRKGFKPSTNPRYDY